MGIQKLGFITPTLMNILNFFIEDPLHEYHEREVVRRTGVSKGSANKMLRLLSDQDFLIRYSKGKMVFYRLNTKDPLARQFKVLINVFSLKKLLNTLNQHSRRIVLFGSCAQGTNVKESDIDLLVLTPEKYFIRKKIAEFNKKKGKRIVPIILDFNEFTKLKREDKPLYENIEKGIVLWEIG